MFRPHFQEGHALLQGECPVIELEEEDAPIMGLVLNILHFRGKDENHVMNARKLASLAIHCDKYDLTNALGAWPLLWFKNVESTSQRPEELGFMLLAAYLFNDSGTFADISLKISKELAPGFLVEWEKEELLIRLPSNISDAITMRIKQTLDRLQAELQNVESSLRQSPRCYKTSQLVCTACGSALPEYAKKSHRCHNSDFPLKYCTSESRIAEYFAALRQVELWPTTKPFGMRSVSDIVCRITRAKTDPDHICAAGVYCPLLMNLNALSETANRIKANINGLCLRCIKEDNEWEGREECLHR
jgi:hypothetical protein